MVIRCPLFGLSVNWTSGQFLHNVHLRAVVMGHVSNLHKPQSDRGSARKQRVNLNVKLLLMSVMILVRRTMKTLIEDGSAACVRVIPRKAPAVAVWGKRWWNNVSRSVRQRHQSHLLPFDSSGLALSLRLVCATTAMLIEFKVNRQRKIEHT